MASRFYSRRTRNPSPGRSPLINLGETLRGRKADKELRELEKSQLATENQRLERDFGLKEREYDLEQEKFGLSKRKQEFTEDMFASEEERLKKAAQTMGIEKRLLTKRQANTLVSEIGQVDDQFGTGLSDILSDVLGFIDESADSRPVLEVYGGVKNNVDQNKEQLLNALQEHKQQFQNPQTRGAIDKVIAEVNNGTLAQKFFPGVRFILGKEKEDRDSKSKNGQGLPLADRKYADQTKIDNLAGEFGAIVADDGYIESPDLSDEDKNRVQQRANQLGVNVYFTPETPWRITGIVPAVQGTDPMMGLRGQGPPVGADSRDEDDPMVEMYRQQAQEAIDQNMPADMVKRRFKELTGKDF